MEAEVLKSKARNPLDTPMIRQYLELKAEVNAKHQNCFLFFRMGDFYEMFLDDARLAAPILGITLTSRNKGNPDEVPLCGFPHHQLDDYVAQMIACGHKVAICEQVEVPDQKLFRREITRVVTPGLCAGFEPGSDEKKSRYLASVFLQGEDTDPLIGIAFADLATGEFRITEITTPADSLLAKVRDEMGRIGPSEVVLCIDQLKHFGNLFESLGIPVTPKSAAHFSKATAVLAPYFPSTGGVEAFGLTHLHAALGAAASIVVYLEETQGKNLSHIKFISTFSSVDYLALDAFTRRNLEISSNLYDGSAKDTLLATLDDCLTKMGSRLLHRWLHAPLVRREAIENRLDAVAAFLKKIEAVDGCVAELENALSAIRDMERLTGRFGLAIAGPRDAVGLHESLKACFAIHAALHSLPAALLQDTRTQLQVDALIKLETFLGERLDLSTAGQIAKCKDAGFVKSGYDAELDGLRLLMRDTKGFIAEIEERERKKTGISSLKIKHNRVFGYYIEITKSNLDMVPDYFIRKQTLVNGERFILPDLKEFEEKLAGAEEKAATLEMEIFEAMGQAVREATPALLAAAAGVAQLDILLAFARQAQRYRYVRPQVNDGLDLSFKELRHPVLERKMNKAAKGLRFVGNDVGLTVEEDQIILITGPNMAGKSTLMRQVALAVLMAQVGCFVPAAEAHVGLVDAIFTRVGASDYLALGQSTFMVEMQETANILRNATQRSLVILDEIGRGTSTYDGLSIAWAVAEYLHDVARSRTLFATHYHELAELPKSHQRIKNFHIAVKEWNGEILFLRKLMRGATNRSYGIEVAKLAGIPEQVIARSKEVLSLLHVDQNLVGGIDRRQMDLFPSTCASTEKVLKRLHQIDISHTNPLEALNILSQIKAQLEDVGN